MTETERISRFLAENAAMSEEERNARAVGEWLRSKSRKRMLDGQRYYENSCDILGRAKRATLLPQCATGVASAPASRRPHVGARRSRRRRVAAGR